MRGRGFQEQKRSEPGFAAQSLLVTPKGNNPREKMVVEADRIKGSPAKDSHVPVTKESSRKREDLQGTCEEG